MLPIELHNVLIMLVVCTYVCNGDTVHVQYIQSTYIDFYVLYSVPQYVMGCSSPKAVRTLTNVISYPVKCFVSLLVIFYYSLPTLHVHIV